MIRSCLLAYIALSLFLGQANIPIFTHVCHGMGETWTSLITPPNACCGKRNKDLEAHHIASVRPKSCVTVDESPCCEDHIKYASLSVQLIHQAVKAVAHDNVVIYAKYFAEELLFFPNPPVYDGIVHVHGPPGKLSGRDLLIAHQLFLC